MMRGVHAWYACVYVCAFGGKGMGMNVWVCMCLCAYGVWGRGGRGELTISNLLFFFYLMNFHRICKNFYSDL